MTTRREFITLLGGAAVAWPLAAGAQQPNQIARIGYLSQESAAFDRSHGDSAAFRDGLGDLGYVEGRNLHIEFRYADADLDRLPALAAELVSLNVDIVVTYSAGTFAAQRVTTTIPIVQVVGSDLVAMGSAASLAHPGGNITGSTFFIPELMAKRLELLKESQRLGRRLLRYGIVAGGEDNPPERNHDFLSLAARGKQSNRTRYQREF
jgi:putative ABC transport system substrate-binding protein